MNEEKNVDRGGTSLSVIKGALSLLLPGVYRGGLPRIFGVAYVTAVCAGERQPTKVNHSTVLHCPDGQFLAAIQERLILIYL